MRKLFLLLVILLSNRCWSVYAQVDRHTGFAVRPTMQEVSLKALNQQYPYMVYRGHTATQTERDAMEETASAIGVPRAVKFARALPNCASEIQKAVSTWAAIPSKLGPGYEFAALRANDVWEIPANGRHYSFEKYALRAIQSCAVGSTNAQACAQKGNVLIWDLLDLRVVNGKCVKGADFSIPILSELFDLRRSRIDPVTTKIAFPPLTPFQAEALHGTHSAHMAVTKWRCGEGPQQPSEIVDLAHQKLEMLAANIHQQHMFMMKRFNGEVDPLWTQAEVCKLARAQDKAHMQWLDAVMLGDWFKSRIAENDHQLAHLCLNLKSTHYQILPYCGAKNIFDCPKYTCEEYVKTL